MNTIWTLKLDEETWKVSNIDEGESLHDYLDLVARQPRAAKVVGQRS